MELTRTQTRLMALERAADDGRIPAVLSSTTPVGRDGFKEVLKHSPDAIDLSRVPLPLLEGHNHRRVNVGIVENLQLDQTDGKLRGLVRFGSSQRAKELLADVRAGIIRSLSVGYQVIDYIERGLTVTVTRWMPFEVSIVGAPADINAGFYRAQPMTEETQSYETHDETAGEFDRGVNAERQRAAELNEIFDSPLVANTDLSGWRTRAMTENWTPDQARKRLLQELSSRAEPAFDHTTVSDDAMGMAHAVNRRSRGYGRIELGQDFSRSHDDLLDAATDALLIRAGLTVKSPHPQASAFRSMSVVDMTRTLARRKGQSADSITRATLLRAGPHTHSDFPLLLGNVASKAALVAMEESELNWRPWTRQVNLPDFKPATLVALGGFSDLDLIPLGGAPYQHGTIGDVGETVKVLTYGKTFGISRVALINDDLGMFASLSRQFALSASRKLSQLAFERLTANPVLTQDNTALFHANHNNLITSGAAPSVDTIAAGIAAMKKQKPYSSGVQPMSGYLNVGPRFILTPTELELTARVVVASAAYPSAGGSVSETAVNPLAAYNMEVISDPLLSDASAKAWYLLADPNRVDTVVVAFLEGSGQFGVTIDSFEPGPDSDAYQWKVRIDAGAAAVDFRGAYKNPGA